MKPIRLLHLEDSIRDAQLIGDILEDNELPATITHVTHKDSFEQEILGDKEFDIILCDHNLTGYDGFSALELARKRRPLTPFLIISGSIGEEEAVMGLQKGATDYLLKERLERLPEAIRRALREADDRRRRLEFEKNLRVNEERMRLALSATNDAIWDLNRQDRSIAVNEVFRELFGEPPAWGENDWWKEHTHPDDQTRVRETWERALENKQHVWSERYRFLKKDGSWAHIENRACISCDEAGEVVRVVGAIQDRTERVQKEEQRKALEEQLVQAQKLEAIGTLAGGIAHDFNNILGIIIANSEIAHAELKMPDTDKEAVAECLDETLTASRRGRDLVRQILTFSRGEESKLHHIKPVEVIRECLRMLRSTLPAMVRLDAHLPEKCSPIKGNETQLQQVLMNLCTNAWHALRNNEGQISVTVDDVSFTSELRKEAVTIPAGDYLRICVSDSGSGMPPDVQARIFDPFFTTKAPGVGTGLGLSVVHGIVRNHGGIITVDSRPGHGTEFSLFFPIASAADADQEEPAIEEKIRGDGQQIMVVDDDAAMAHGTERVLKRNGYKVVTFNSPERALESLLLGDVNPDLIITDYSMPRITGAELAQHVADHEPDLPVILLTGMGDSKVRRQAHGVAAVAEKPIWPEELCQLVGKVLLTKQAAAADNKQRRVLVVDDDPAHLSACARILRQSNYSVFTANDGAEALQMLKSIEVDAVLTDILMPEKEGLEVILTLRRERPKIRIIAMSGGGRLSAEECLTLSQGFKADQAILKPFSRDELLSRLQAVFEAAPQGK